MVKSSIRKGTKVVAKGTGKHGIFKNRAKQSHGTYLIVELSNGYSGAFLPDELYYEKDWEKGKQRK